MADDDAELVALVDRVIRINAEQDRIMDPHMERVGGPPDDVMAVVWALTPIYHQVMTQIGNIPAHTHVGKVAKARAALLSFSLDPDEVLEPDHDHFVVWSLCKEIIGEVGC